MKSIILELYRYSWFCRLRNSQQL